MNTTRVVFAAPAATHTALTAYTARCFGLNLVDAVCIEPMQADRLKLAAGCSLLQLDTTRVVFIVFHLAPFLLHDKCTKDVRCPNILHATPPFFSSKRRVH